VEAYLTRAIGVEYLLDFWGINTSLKQFKLHSSYEEPLVGKNIVKKQSVVRPCESLSWDVIPGELFYTRETLS
jgi:hypothetical protein